LATYPLEEKRTEDIIENGSKEIGEPVFLEIEPKIEEEIKLVRDEEEKVFKLDEKGDLIIENLIENNKKSVVTNPKPEKKEILLSGALPEGQNSETELPENQKVPFYKSKEFLEQFIGLSVIAIVLASLLLLLYYNLN
jgi:fructose-1-phosphate kinase PfkB-like protein